MMSAARRHGRPDGVLVDASRAVYRDHCKSEPTIPLFSQPWLLDTVAPGSWGAVIEGQPGKEIIGTLPYVVRREFGLLISSGPALVPRLGPWVRSSGSHTTKALSHEHHVLGALADNMPEFDHFAQNWNPEMSNWLPFYWRGYQQTTRYTYRIELTDSERMWWQMNGSARTEIRKAQDRHGLVAVADRPLEDLLRLNSQVFARQRMRTPYSDQYVRDLDAAFTANAGRLVLIVEDEDGRQHAGCYVVWDNQCAYYLLGGSDPSLRSSGAVYLALWEAIQYVSGRTRIFDFEGSMIQPIEHSFRSFGGAQVPYHSLRRTPSRRAQIALAAKARRPSLGRVKSWNSFPAR